VVFRQAEVYAEGTMSADPTGCSAGATILDNELVKLDQRALSCRRAMRSSRPALLVMVRKCIGTSPLAVSVELSARQKDAGLSGLCSRPSMFRHESTLARGIRP
jgi:hypothetical protein